jgi:hypothetical protein
MLGAMPKKPQPDLAQLFNLPSLGVAEDARELTVLFLRSVRERAGQDAVSKAAASMIYAASGILAREASVGRAHDVLDVAAKAVEQL